MRKFYFWAAVIWTTFITVLCLISMRNFQGITTEENADKYVHASFYITLTALWTLYAYRAFTNRGKVRLAVFIATVLFGVLIEVCQGLFTQDRSPDMTDVFANSSGSLVATLLFWIADKVKKH